jgi:membrane protein implicated in regulation of membrane protease activity
MWPAAIWLAVALVLALAEVLSGEFVLLMLGGGALAAGVAALLGGGLVVSGAVFAVVSVALVLGVRPVVKRRLAASVDPVALHSDALVGRAGVVVTEVDGRGGRIKIGGDLWSARSVDHEHVIAEGAAVTVLAIEGATAVVVQKD